jgi:hypothetical protein
MRQPRVETALESGVTTTSGIPNRWELLEEMVLNMRDDKNKAHNDEIDMEISRVMSMHQEETLERCRHSPSGELIPIPNLSSLYENVSQRESYFITVSITLINGYHMITE